MIMCMYLLNAGTDPNITDCLGNTPLIAAAGCSTIPIDNLILKSGVHKKITASSENIQVRYFCIRENAVKHFIMFTGKLINQRNKFGENALDYYLLNFESHSQDIILILFAAGEVSNINLQVYMETRKIDVPHIIKPSLNCKNLCINVIGNHLQYLNYICTYLI